MARRTLFSSRGHGGRRRWTAYLEGDTAQLVSFGPVVLADPIVARGDFKGIGHDRPVLFPGTEQWREDPILPRVNWLIRTGVCSKGER